jgi:hypothetical protein
VLENLLGLTNDFKRAFIAEVNSRQIGVFSTILDWNSDSRIKVDPDGKEVARTLVRIDQEQLHLLDSFPRHQTLETLMGHVSHVTVEFEVDRASNLVKEDANYQELNKVISTIITTDWSAVKDYVKSLESVDLSICF